MIRKTHSFEYKGKVLVERAIIQPPITHERVFQNQGCFMYIKNTSANVHSSLEKLKVESREAVLFQCDTFFVEFLKNDKEVEVIAFHLYPDVLKQIYEKELPTKIIEDAFNVKAKKIVDSEIISEFIKSFEFYFQNPTLVNDDLLELKIKELILLLIQSKNVESVLELVKNLYSTSTINIKEVIELHLHSNLAAKDIAKLCQMSLSTFKREFKKLFNDTPLNYITKRRIEKAEHLLRISDLSISEIAYELGYNDPQYFARMFKKHTSLTPTIYRAQFIKYHQ